MNSRLARMIIVTLLVAGCGLLVLLTQLSDSIARRESVTSFSRNALGLSAFSEFVQQLSGRTPLIKKSAVLAPEDLESASAFIISSPLLPVSERERRILLEWVNKGGTLVLSFHQGEQLQLIESIVGNVFGKVILRENPEFINGQSESAVVTHESKIVEQITPLRFYSPFLFDRAECSVHKSACFMMEQTHGTGKVVLLAGLTPISNALIGLGGNIEFAEALVRMPGLIIVDEYRHSYTEKGLGDLLLLPSFTLPLAALIVGALLFFLLGAPEEKIHADLLQQQRKPLVYHDFTRRAFQGLVAGDPEGLVRLQGNFLREVFPRDSDRIDLAEGSPSQKTDRQREEESWRALTALHQTLLRERIPR